jgi:hypothetical protein
MDAIITLNNMSETVWWFNNPTDTNGETEYCQWLAAAYPKDVLSLSNLHDPVAFRKSIKKANKAGWSAQCLLIYTNEAITNLHLAELYPLMFGVTPEFGNEGLKRVPNIIIISNSLPATSALPRSWWRGMVKPQKVLKDPYRLALTSANVPLCKWFEKMQYTLPNDYAYTAGKTGNIKLLKWCRTVCPLRESSIRGAIVGNHLAVIQWFVKHDHSFDRAHLGETIQSGHLEILIYLHYHVFPSIPLDLHLAAQYGHLHILQWAEEIGIKIELETLDYSIKSNRLAIVQWLVERGFIYTAEEVITAIISRNFEVLKWVYTRVKKHSPTYCEIAAEVGSLTIPQWLREQGCSWNIMVPANAARYTSIGCS